MVYVVIAYLWTAILLYLLLGGADFGAGIIELFTSDNNKVKTSVKMSRTIGPIWEANHMWLIIVIVILFTGFPEIYSSVSTLSAYSITNHAHGNYCQRNSFCVSTLRCC